MIEAKVSERLENVALLVLKMEEGLGVKEHGWPPESGKGEEPDSLREPPENTLCSGDTLT